MPTINPFAHGFEDWAPPVVEVEQPHDLSAYDHKNAQDADPDIDAIIESSTAQLKELNDTAIAQESVVVLRDWMRKASQQKSVPDSIGLISARSALTLAQRRLGCSFECLKLSRAHFESAQTYSKAYLLAHEELSMTNTATAVASSIKSLIDSIRSGFAQTQQYVNELMTAWQLRFKHHTYPVNEDELRANAGNVTLSKETIAKLYGVGLSVEFSNILEWVNQVMDQNTTHGGLTGAINEAIDFAIKADFYEDQTVSHLVEVNTQTRLYVPTWLKDFGDVKVNPQSVDIIPKYGSTRCYVMQFSDRDDVGFSFTNKDCTQVQYKVNEPPKELARLSVSQEHLLAAMTSKIMSYNTSFSATVDKANAACKRLESLSAKAAKAGEDAFVSVLAKVSRFLTSMLVASKAMHLHCLSVLTGLVAWAKASQSF